MKVLAYNIWVGARGKVDLLIEFLRNMNCDAVALLECNDWTSDLLEQRAHEWNHDHSFLLKTKSGFHIGITCCFPINVENHIVETFAHGVLHVKIKGLNIFVTHLSPGSVGARLKEASQIRELISTISRSEEIVLVGDMNSLSELDRDFYAKNNLEDGIRSDVHQSIKFLNPETKQLDYTVIQSLMYGERQLQDCNTNPEPSVPTHLRVDKMHASEMRLDYAFVTTDLAKKGANCVVVKTDETHNLSDHYPVQVDLPGF